MSAQSATEVMAPRTGINGNNPGKPLVLVVGYDGSPPAERALHKAAEILEHRDGWLEVVFVAHTPATAPFSPQAMTELVRDFDEESDMLEKQVGARLINQPRHWRFQRRDGAEAVQLLAAAKELQDRYGDCKEIAIVVGGPAKRYHHISGSVSSSLARAGRFPVVVIP